MIAVGYIRISVQDQSTYSKEFQEQAIRDYCLRNELGLVNFFTDDGESSYTFDRQNFKKLEKSLKRGAIIVVYHLDRFSRNMAEAMLKIKYLLDHGIKVRDVSEPIGMDDYDTNTFLLRSMKFMAAETELRRIRERTQKGIEAANLQGRTVNRAPFGYKNARDDRNRPILTLVPKEAELVREIYNMFISGKSIAQIKELTKNAGVPQGNSGIQRVLTQPIYLGKVKLPSGKLIAGLHEPIIDEQTFYQAQAIMDRRSHKTHRTDNMELKGTLYCPCGKCMTSSNPKSKSGKTFWYYVCPVHKKNYNADKLHKQFHELLKEITIPPAEVAESKKNFMEAVNKYFSEDPKALQAEATRIETKIKQAQEKYMLSEDITRKAFEETTKKLRHQLLVLNNKIEAITTGRHSLLESGYKILDTYGDLENYWNRASESQRRDLAILLFPGVLYYDLDIYRTPFASDLVIHKLLILKDKRLLEIQKSLPKFGSTPISTRYGNIIEHLMGGNQTNGFASVAYI